LKCRIVSETLLGKVFYIYGSTWHMLSGSLSPRQGASSGCGQRDSLQIWTKAANIFNKQI